MGGRWRKTRCRFIGRLLPQLAPAHIVEFGSGLSSRFLARQGAHLAVPPWITSIDHDPEFGIGGAGVPDYPRLRYQLAPVVGRDFGGKLLPSYYVIRRNFATAEPPDLVIIDGPPNCLGGREGVLYQAIEWARPGTVVLIDDASRREEQSAMACWKDTLGEAITFYHLSGFAKGLSAIVIHEPVPMASLWSRRLNGSRADVRRLVPADTLVVLIDDNCVGTDFLIDRKILPFLEQDGVYWGAPQFCARDHGTGKNARERCGRCGALMDVYVVARLLRRILEYVSAKYPCLVQNDRVAVFNLQ